MSDRRDATINAVHELGIVRPRDVRRVGGHPGLLDDDFARFAYATKLGPGLFGDNDWHYGPTAQATVRWPAAVICMTSALWVHRMVNREPASPWLAIRAGAWMPKNTYGVRFARMRNSVFEQDIESRRIDGIDVRVYSIAKTLADCLRFRKHLTPHVPEKCVRFALREGICTQEELLVAARKRRVECVLREVLAGRNVWPWSWYGNPIGKPRRLRRR